MFEELFGLEWLRKHENLYDVEQEDHKANILFFSEINNVNIFHDAKQEILTETNLNTKRYFIYKKKKKKLKDTYVIFRNQYM